MAGRVDKSNQTAAYKNTLVESTRRIITKAFPATGISLSTCSTVPPRDERTSENRNPGRSAGFAQDPRLHYTDRHPETSPTRMH